MCVCVCVCGLAVVNRMTARKCVGLRNARGPRTSHSNETRRGKVMQTAQTMMGTRGSNAMAENHNGHNKDLRQWARERKGGKQVSLIAHQAEARREGLNTTSTLRARGKGPR